MPLVKKEIMEVVANDAYRMQKLVNVVHLGENYGDLN